MRTSVIAALLLSVASPACKRDAAPAPGSTPTAAPGAAAASLTPPANVPPPPVDHLAPGELAEGEAGAFGLPFPRGTTALVVLGEYARGEILAPARNVEAYYRARLAPGVANADGNVVRFGPVKRKDLNGPRLEIHVAADRERTGITRVELWNREPPTLPPRAPASAMSDEERFRAAGIDKNGRTLDLKRTE